MNMDSITSYSIKYVKRLITWFVLFFSFYLFFICGTVPIINLLDDEHNYAQKKKN